MEHPGEIWQEYDYNGTRLGGIEPDNHGDSKVKLFGGAAIMLYRYHDGEIEFLFQHRSKNLRDNADKWDVSAGGHINLDEPELFAAVRETREEIGATLDKAKLEFSAIYNRGNFALVHLYFYDWTGQPDNFHFDDQEVSEVKWVNFSDLVDFWPSLKPQVRDDQFFQAMLLEQVKIIRSKYGNLDK